MSELITGYHGVRNTLVFVGIISAPAAIVLFLK
jgi:hypothetical protein